jgi:hypothetical protein
MTAIRLGHESIEENVVFLDKHPAENREPEGHAPGTGEG